MARLCESFSEWRAPVKLQSKGMSVARGSAPRGPRHCLIESFELTVRAFVSDNVQKRLYINKQHYCEYWMALHLDGLLVHYHSQGGRDDCHQQTGHSSRVSMSTTKV